MDIKKLTAKLDKLQTEITLTKEVDVASMKFTLRPMDSMEEQKLQDLTQPFEGIQYLMVTKRETLARSIFMIDGEILPEEFPGEKEGDPTIERAAFLKTKIIQPLPQMAVDLIYSAYLVLQLELQEKSNTSVKFTNAELIAKFMADNQADKVAATVDKVTQNIVDSQNG